MRYFDMPGIDIVGYQVTPGLDAGTNRWDPDSGPDWDQEFFQFDLPAMARGAALIKDSPEIGEIAAGIAAVVFRPGNQNLMVSRRKAKDGEWIIIHNRSLDAAAVGRWTVHGRRGEIARFDAEQGRYFTVPFAADQDGLEATLDIPPGALWCLRLGARVPETAAAVAFQYRKDFKTDFPWGNRERLAGPGFTPESDSLGGVAASGDTGY